MTFHSPLHQGKMVEGPASGEPGPPAGRSMSILKVAHNAVCKALDRTDEWVRRVSYEGTHHRKK